MTSPSHTRNRRSIRHGLEWFTQQLEVPSLPNWSRRLPWHPSDRSPHVHLIGAYHGDLDRGSLSHRTGTVWLWCAGLLIRRSAGGARLWLQLLRHDGSSAIHAVTWLVSLCEGVRESWSQPLNGILRVALRYNEIILKLHRHAVWSFGHRSGDSLGGV
jgi:hypothetical protein